MSTRIPASTLEDLLDSHPVARLATLDDEMNIHQVPVVFVRLDGVLWSPVDGKPKQDRELTRVKNVRRNPDVNLLLDAYEEDWSGLWWISIRGSARVVEVASATDEHIAGVVTALRRKYPQYDDTAVLRDPAMLIAITPVKINSWRASHRVHTIRG